MSTTHENSTIPSTAVEAAPGLWRTNLQRYDWPALVEDVAVRSGVLTLKDVP